MSRNCRSSWEGRELYSCTTGSSTCSREQGSVPADMEDASEENQAGLLSDLGVTAVPVAQVEGTLLEKVCWATCAHHLTLCQGRSWC